MLGGGPMSNIKVDYTEHEKPDRYKIQDLTEWHGVKIAPDH